ncbi:ORF MSV201 hypothetical protein [Melanoplus sanguinipes entomopoxvirus]|uniref:Uncharacterized protein n=1 Tax=Melanoplus sanguinipes entomopoxvirus TaxID=83191 RepID=Q9YVP1_MSEPV|nr:ORF MSV201 hypothetical protein [Melanoplus sanguinipes entomopoxvirus]AAC97759.1 ORF MSV201 hypothetical protein [Melanoplus sanguinipes entomopoxvirus 'O']
MTNIPKCHIPKNLMMFNNMIISNRICIAKYKLNLLLDKEKLLNYDMINKIDNIFHEYYNFEHSNGIPINIMKLVEIIMDQESNILNIIHKIENSLKKYYKFCISLPENQESYIDIEYKFVNNGNCHKRKLPENFDDDVCNYKMKKIENVESNLKRKLSENFDDDDCNCKIKKMIIGF